MYRQVIGKTEGTPASVATVSDFTDDQLREILRGQKINAIDLNDLVNFIDDKGGGYNKLVQGEGPNIIYLDTVREPLRETLTSKGVLPVLDPLKRQYLLASKATRPMERATSGGSSLRLVGAELPVSGEFAGPVTTATTRGAKMGAQRVGQAYGAPYGLAQKIGSKLPSVPTEIAGKQVASMPSIGQAVGPMVGAQSGREPISPQGMLDSQMQQQTGAATTPEEMLDMQARSVQSQTGAMTTPEEMLDMQARGVPNFGDNNGGLRDINTGYVNLPPGALEQIMGQGMGGSYTFNDAISEAVRIFPNGSESEILSTAKALFDSKNTQEDPLSPSEIEFRNNADSAQASLQTLRETLGDDGSGRVPWESVLPWEGGTERAQVYRNAAVNIIDLIARSRTGAAINLSEQQMYDKFIPGVMDTEASRKNKLETLERLLRTVEAEQFADNNQYSGYGQQDDNFGGYGQ